MIARWLIAAVVTFAVGICAAQPPEHDLELARQHFVRGKQLAGESHFSDAYDEFAIGYGLSGRPQFLFNMAECRRALGEPDARDLYQRYLAMDPQGELAPTARARIAEQASPPPNTHPRIADQATAMPSSTPVAAPATVTTTTTSVPDRTIVRIPTPAVAASTVVAPPSTTATIFVDPPARPLWRRPAAWIGVGTALIAGSVAIYAVTRHSNQCTPPSCVMAQ